VKAYIRVITKELFHPVCFVSREIVGNYVDFFAAPLMRHNVS
jgi:hypothetical protein